jgi:putative hydrolase of HD superfamily
MKNKTTPQQLDSIHQFLHVSEGLKTLLRHSWLSNGRQESVAEHTWRMSLMAVVLHSKIESTVNLGHVLEMITIHDLAEITLRIFTLSESNKHELEEQGLKEVVKDLDDVTKTPFSLWQEFESRTTDEATPHALDKLKSSFSTTRRAQIADEAEYLQLRLRL